MAYGALIPQPYETRKKEVGLDALTLDKLIDTYKKLHAKHKLSVFNQCAFLDAIEERLDLMKKIRDQMELHFEIQ